MKPEELQAIREDLLIEHELDETTAYKLLDEIQKLRTFVDWIAYDAPPRWAKKAVQCLEGHSSCTCALSDVASLSCPLHGLDAKKRGVRA